MPERDGEHLAELSYSGDNTSEYLRMDNIDELRYHLSYGASPLANIEHPDVLRAQNEVVQPLILQRVEQSAPEGTPTPLRQFMEQAFLNRFVGRAMRNREAYDERLEKNASELSSSVYSSMHDRAIRGSAHPGELLIVRKIEKMKAIELARLTHPYGFMIEELEPMRRAVALAVHQQGGMMLDPQDYNEQFKVRSADLLMNPERKDEAMGLLMTRRRMIGMLPDDTAILERSSFVVPIYEGSKFDPELSYRMRQVTLVGNESRIRQLEEAGNLKEVAPLLLESNNFDAAIPLSTTIFAFNKTTAAEIAEYKRTHGSAKTLRGILDLTMKERFYRPGDLKWTADKYNDENPLQP